MRRNIAVAGLLPLLVLRAGCGGNPTDPTPSPSPRAKPDATALENLQLIRSLEQATGRGGVLYLLSGFGSQTGRLVGGDAWEYNFAQPLPTGRNRLYTWSVWIDGRVSFRDDLSPTGSIALVDISPRIAIDSPEAARLGRSYGGQAFVDRWPTARIRMGCVLIGGRVVWSMEFFLPPSEGGPICRLPIVVDAQTGELLFRDLQCLS